MTRSIFCANHFWLLLLVATKAETFTGFPIVKEHEHAFLSNSEDVEESHEQDVVLDNLMSGMHDRMQTQAASRGENFP